MTRNPQLMELFSTQSSRDLQLHSVTDQKILRVMDFNYGNCLPSQSRNSEVAGEVDGRINDC